MISFFIKLFLRIFICCIAMIFVGEQSFYPSACQRSHALLRHIEGSGIGLYINSAEATPTASITLTGNNSNTNYTIDAGTGTFNLAPCNAASVNTGTINTAGTVTAVQSCPGGVAC